MILMILFSGYTYSQQTKLFVKYVKFTNPRDSMGEKLYNYIKQEFAAAIEPHTTPDYIKEENHVNLNTYYIQFFKNYKKEKEYDFITDSDDSEEEQQNDPAPLTLD